MLRCYLATSKLQRPSLSLDATGEVLKGFDDQNGQILVSSLILQHPCPKVQQIPVAIMMSNSHDTSSYTNFLQRFWLSLCPQLPVHPECVVIDWNWPSIHACCLVFNNLGIVQYLALCKYIVDGKLDLSGIRNFVIIGIGRSHFIREITRWKEITRHEMQEESVAFWKYASVHLITFTNWDSAKEYLRHLVTVLLSPSEENCATSVNFVKDSLADSRSYDPDSVLEEVCVEDQPPILEPSHRSETIYSQSLFHQECLVIYDTVRKTFPNTSSSRIYQENMYRNDSLANKLLTTILPYFPMVSGILWQAERYAKDCLVELEQNSRHQGWREAFVEGWHAIMKHHILESKLPLWPQEFTKKMLASLNGRTREFLERIPKQTCQRKRNTQRRVVQRQAPPHQVSFSSSSSLTSDISSHLATNDSESLNTKEVCPRQRKRVAVDISQQCFQNFRNTSEITLDKSLQKQDEFRVKASVAKISKYLSPPKSVSTRCAIVGLPTGGSTLLRSQGSIHLSSASTCCVDTLLTIFSVLYKNCASVSDAVNASLEGGVLKEANPNSFQFFMCVRALAISATEEDAIKARGEFFFLAPLFSSELASIPLSRADKENRSMHVCVDANETMLAEHFILPLSRVFREHSCQNTMCDSSIQHLKFILITDNSVTTTVEQLQTCRVSGECGRRISLRNEGEESDEELEMRACTEQEVNDFCQMSGKVRAMTGANEGAYVPEIVCGAARLAGPLQGDPPSFVVFTQPERLLSDGGLPPKVESPPLIKLLNKDYHLCAATYFKRPKAVKGSGHYVAVVSIDNVWHLYDGSASSALRFRVVSAPHNPSVRHLEPCIFVYAALRDAD
jgi:hypothetical protein